MALHSWAGPIASLLFSYEMSSVSCLADPKLSAKAKLAIRLTFLLLYRHLLTENMTANTRHITTAYEMKKNASSLIFEGDSFL